MRKALPQQPIVLESREGFALCEIRPEHLPESRTGRTARPDADDLVRIQVSAVDVANQKVLVHKVMGLHRKRHADLFSKIAFQHQARTMCGVSFQAIQDVVAASTYNTGSLLNALPTTT